MASHHGFCAVGPLRIGLAQKFCTSLPKPAALSALRILFRASPRYGFSTMSRQMRKFVRTVERTSVMDYTLTESSRGFTQGIIAISEKRLSRFILTGPPRPRGARVYSIYAVMAVSLDLSGICNLIGINSKVYKLVSRTV
jgi:hypothetical protein